MSKKIKWTDKVQAIASIIAILGGLAGFYKLFSTDKEVQSQIENLTTIAKESSEQSRIMRDELEISRMRNNLLLEQLGIDKEKWRKQIRPDFFFDFENFDSHESYNNISSKIFGCNLYNQGGSGHLIKIVPNPNNTFKIDIPYSYIANQGKIKFNISYSNTKDYCFDVNLIYKDFEGTIYSQRYHTKKIPLNKFEGLEYLDIISDKPKIIENK